MTISGKRVFISGGAGFVGVSILDALLEDNEVIVYDTLERDALSGRSAANHPHLQIIRGDVLNTDHLYQAMSDADVVIHLAAVAGIDTVIVSPTRTMRVNMLGSANVLDAALRQGKCDRVLCFSTSEIFGSYAFRSEETDRAVTGAVGEARWTYAVSKLAEEHLAHAYHQEFGLPTVVIRPFNVYGPNQVGDGAIRTFIERAIRNEDIEVHGDGTQIRAWCYVDDIVQAILLCLEREEAVGESFNIGNPRAVMTIYGLANAVVRVTQSKSRILFTEKAYADVELRIPNVEKARRILGFEAKVDLDDGIARTAEWYGVRLAGDTAAG